MDEDRVSHAVTLSKKVTNLKIDDDLVVQHGKYGGSLVQNGDRSFAYVGQPGLVHHLIAAQIVQADRAVALYD